MTPYTLPTINIDETSLEVMEWQGGLRHLYTFSNGYQASVVHFPYSYGIELAILRNGELDYTTPLTDDVVAYIDETELESLLHQVKGLPAPN